jgi:general secretion pathway protein N
MKADAAAPLARLFERWRDRLPTRQPPQATSVFADSSIMRAAWDRHRRSATRAAWWAVPLGALAGIVVFAPATWLAAAVNAATGERLLLAEARGSVWNGSAVVVLTGGAGSRDASALPGRLNWRIGLKGFTPELRLAQPCCIEGTLSLQIKPALDHVKLILPAAPQGVGQWPAAWLAGLGTPFNTLQLGGTLRLATPGAGFELGRNGLRQQGVLLLDINDMSSRVSTLDRLGSYRLQISSDAAGGSSLQLTTTAGPLRLTGSGQWLGAVGRFNGEASAEPGSEGALDNLLNIIGRRQGTRSIISIG